MMDYKKAGVDIEAGYKSVELMKEYVKGTMRPEVLGGLGGFSGAFSMSAFKGMEEPTLLSGTDGVGTKLKLAFLMDKHDTVGIDCVAMCVNDVACAGGEPLFFLDYIACGKNVPEKIATIVKGVAEGCRQSGSALIGGETAGAPEMLMHCLNGKIQKLIAIGSSTKGQNVATEQFINEEFQWSVNPVVATIYDSEHDTYPGFKPTYSVNASTDYLTFLPFGDEKETLLSVALGVLNGTYPPKEEEEETPSTRIKIEKSVNSPSSRLFIGGSGLRIK